MKSIRRLVDLFNDGNDQYYIYIITASKGNIYFGFGDRYAKVHCTKLVNSIEEFFTWFTDWVND